MVRRKEMPLWQELPLLLVVAFCLAVLIRTFLVQAFYIPSGSMENTLLVQDRVLVNKVVYDMRDPLRGEIVVFRGTDNWAPEVTEEVSNTFAAKLGRLARLTLPRFADACVIDVLDEEGDLRCVYSAHALPEKDALHCRPE